MNDTPRIRLKSPLLPILVGVLLLAQILAPYDGWLILFVGLGGAWLVGYLWVRALAGRLYIRREMRFGWAQVGDRLEERFTLANRSFVPCLWVEVIDHTLMPGYQVSRVSAVGSFSDNRWHTQGLCTRRGVYTLGPTSLRTSDPLGIYTLEVHDSTSRTLMVTPPIVPLPFIEVAAGGRAGEGRPRPNAPERTVSAAGVREYFPGDSLRDIHWRTTARKDDLFVRLMDGTPAGDWWIILDVNSRFQAGQGQDSTEEHAVILAASLADRGLRLRKAVGIAANSRAVTWLPPRQGDQQRWELLRSLAILSPGDHPLGELLHRLKPSFGKRTSLILITTDVEGKWVKDLLPLIWLGAVPTVLLLDPKSFGGSGEAKNILDLLAGLGVKRYLITRDLLDRPEARPGREGQWEWRVTPTGKAILVNEPKGQDWKVLS